MAFQDLDGSQLLQGILGFIWVCFAIFIGIRIIFKAKKLKRNELIIVGTTYILLSSAWWGVAIQFIVFGFFSQWLPIVGYIFIANFFIPIALVCWIYSFTKMVNPDLTKKFLAIFIPYCIIWELIIISFCFIDVSVLGSLDASNFDSSHGPIFKYIVMVSVLSFVISGIYFSIKSMSLDDPEIKWKGRFLLMAWFAFGLGAALDSFLKDPADIILIVIRVILIASAYLYDLGFFLPKSLKKRVVN
ncbi:MAG: hypothetical protein KGD63_13880 [Candidatus Lokiarchaeota archaeon]|nr:hypothetical protein [Candidatus Lokiarchaeota archaeon]